MSETNKHSEEARRIVGDYLELEDASHTQLARLIAQGLRAAEQEGMRRAAEHVLDAHTAYAGMRWGIILDRIRRTILSEAGGQ